MGACCGTQASFGSNRSDEPSAWQLATADDFYDSEAGEHHDELGIIELQPPSSNVSRIDIGKLEEELPNDDSQVVSLDFNLAPKKSIDRRPSQRRASTTSAGSSRESTEGLVLTELAALNELRGSGSMTPSLRSSAALTGSAVSSEFESVAREEKEAQASAEDSPQMDGTVIVHNSESVYSYTFGETTDSALRRDLGGVLSGEDDEDSVVSPLVNTTNTTGAVANKSAPPSAPAPATATSPTPRTSTPLNTSRSRKPSTDLRYLALGSEDSTEYEDALASEQIAT